MSDAWWLVGAACLLAVLPWLIGGYYLGVTTKMMIFGLFAASLNLILGYGGLASLGHAAYFGIGAYALAKLATHGVDSFWLQMGLAVCAAVVTAALFGLLILRARGAYLLMITLALAQILWGVAYGWRDYTGGDDGIPGLKRPSRHFPWNLTDDIGFYYMVFAVFCVLMFCLRVLIHSPFGRALVGIRENERRMLVLGYNVWLYKYVACILAGLLAGVAGGLMTWQAGFAGPSYLSVAYSATALIMVILGGAGTFAGPLIGAFVIVGLENFVSGYTDRWVLVLGVTYVIVTLFAPQGLVGLYLGRVRRSIQ
ncbi:MAG: branched-chain amino acid ABC transporter permease [Burkholderiaceae bacterium]|nr:branched-chain amino acid ABC transporter permease [Burkholderiaceae bacterium]